jgi:hypothetical protein
MDTVVVVVNGPLNKALSNHEYYLDDLNFLDEIRACDKKRGGSNIIGANYLRAIAEEVGKKYDKSFNPYRHVVPTDYSGRVSNSIEETAAIVKEMFLARYPQIFDKYLEYKFKTRPFGTKIVYLNGSEDQTVDVFSKLGVKILKNEDLNLDTVGDIKDDENLDDYSGIAPEHAVSEYLSMISDSPVEDPNQESNLSILSDLAAKDEQNSDTRRKIKIDKNKKANTGLALDNTNKQD